MALMAPPEHSDDASRRGSKAKRRGQADTGVCGYARRADDRRGQSALSSGRAELAGRHHVHPLVQALKKFWAPVPWMLEAAMVLEVVLGDFTEAGVIAGLLVFNAGVGLYQEGKAQTTLTALKSRLA